MALDYKKRLQAIDPDINYLMTLYLHESMIENPEMLREAKKAGIAGVKVLYAQNNNTLKHVC